MDANCCHVARQAWLHTAASGQQGCKAPLKCFFKEVWKPMICFEEPFKRSFELYVFSYRAQCWLSGGGRWCPSQTALLRSFLGCGVAAGTSQRDKSSFPVVTPRFFRRGQKQTARGSSWKQHLSKEKEHGYRTITIFLLTCCSYSVRSIFIPCERPGTERDWNIVHAPSKLFFPVLSLPAPELAAKAEQLQGTWSHPGFWRMKNAPKPPSFAERSIYCHWGG